MIERQVMTEPFEAMEFDLVGPLPKAKGGFRFNLTAMCQASRWPEAIPIKSVTEKVVAKGMLEVVFFQNRDSIGGINRSRVSICG